MEKILTKRAGFINDLISRSGFMKMIFLNMRLSESGRDKVSESVMHLSEALDEALLERDAKKCPVCGLDLLVW